MTKSVLLSLIIFYARMFDVDVYTAIAVARVESNFNVNAVGAIGELGVYQIRPEYYKGYTKKTLLNPYINVPFGILALKEAKDNCPHKKKNNWLVCYNYGIKNAEKVKYPHKFTYVMEVNKRIKEIKKTRLLDNNM